MEVKKLTNSCKKYNFVWLGMVLMFVLVMTGFVSAGVGWNDTAYNQTYYFSEDAISYYNFTVNVTELSDLNYFSILSITWVNGTIGTDQSAYYWLPWNDSDNTNSTSGVLKINATNNNETGNFTLNVYAQGSATGASAYFNFIINASNDPPQFSLNPSYNISVPVVGNTSKDISLVGSDEEKQYPLVYNVSFLNCSHASWSSKTDCNLTYNMSEVSNTTSTLAISNLTYNDIGVYNLTICSHDDWDAVTPPLYRDANYDENKSTCKNTTLTLLSSLSIDVSNCTGQNLTEGDWLNCTINITTVGETDPVNISSNAFFSDLSYTASNSSWFYPASSANATNFIIPVNISILLTKEDVGNWTINFSATDGISKVSKPISLFVNYTESNPSLDSIPDISIYENKTFTVNAYDEDLLILDGSVKDEQLTYASNTSWVTATSPSSSHSTDYTTSTININYDNISALGDANYSISINVTDVAGDVSTKNFTIQILQDNAPNWSSNLSSPVVLNLTEGTPFNYNVSENVSDADNDTITFYYQNVSTEFCSLNSSNFNSVSGIINFTPVDCDVGFHNVTIIASDGKLNSSHQFTFNISNIDDLPSISTFTGTNITKQYDLNEHFIFKIPYKTVSNFSLVVADDDFLILQRNYYNESLTVNTTITNSTNNDTINLFNFSFVEFAHPSSEDASYSATFTPNISQIGNYTVFINITDKSGNSTNRTFYLYVVSVNYPPNLSLIDNQSVTINGYLNFTVNANDTEDDYNGINLSYSIKNLTVGSPNLKIGNNTGIIEFNMSSNESYAGVWKYNVTVTDSDGLTDTKSFYLSVYGRPNITIPKSDYVFNWTEGVPTGNLNFSVNYGVNNTKLVYLFYLDKIIFSNLTAFNYSNSTIISPDNLRNESNWTWTNNSNFSWNFTPSYTDESYGMLKNLTLIVYNFDYPEINTSINWKVNISHTNQNVSFAGHIPDQNGYKGGVISVNLSKYFEDVDYWDKAINQVVNFTIVTKDNYTNNVEHGSSFNNWTLNLLSPVATDEIIEVVAHEYDSSNTLINNATSNQFEVKLTNPPIKKVVTPVTTTVTKLKLYALRIIVPHDIIISDKNYIEIPFSLQNVGETDLSGINLSSRVLFNNGFSKNVKVSLGTNYVPLLKVGETKNYSMTISADTSKSGRYKATLFANITSPKFQDWGDFFIDLRKTNDTEVDQTMIFTEKLIVENPECLELTELFNRAKVEYSSGNFSGAMNLAHQVSDACESAIIKNSQIKDNKNGFVKNIVYYISFATLIIFFIGFIFYIYKRVRFNKSKMDEYV